MKVVRRVLPVRLSCIELVVIPVLHFSAYNHCRSSSQHRTYGIAHHPAIAKSQGWTEKAKIEDTHLEPQLLLGASGLPPKSICEADGLRLALWERSSEVALAR